MKSELKILFEDCGDKLDINPNLKYCFYAKGCYCPPHKGHLYQICKFVKNNKNAKIIINQIGSESRHGVDQYLNCKIMYLYLKKLLPRNSFELIHNKTSLQAQESKFAKKCDVFVNLRGIERKIKDCKYERKSKYLSYYNKSKKLLAHGKEVIFYYTSRPLVATLCATKFVEHLIKYKNDEINLSQLYYFCPSGVSNRIKDYVIEKLLEMPYLKVNKK